MNKVTVVQFEPDRGNELLSNLKQHLHLLDRASELPELRGGDAERVRIEVLAALHVAFNPKLATIRNRPCFDHLWALNGHNRHVLRLLKHPEPVEIEVPAPTGPKRIALGPAVGFTTVYPLTDNGFARLVSTEIGMAQLVPEEVVSSEDVGGASSFYIGGVVDVRSLNHPDWVVEGRGRALFGILGHLGLFLPTLKWYPAAPRERLVASDGRRLPRLCAFAAPGSAGEQVLWRAGFRKVGVKWDGEVKYALDLEDWNEGRLDSKRSGQVLKMIRGIQHTALRLRGGARGGKR